MSQPATPATPTPSDCLNPGAALNINQTLVSANGNYTLIMQPDHSCDMYQKDKGPLWSAGTAPDLPAQSLLFRADGELEILDIDGGPKWQAWNSWQRQLKLLLSIQR